MMYARHDMMWKQDVTNMVEKYETSCSNGSHDADVGHAR